MNLFAERPQVSPERRAEMKRWVVEAFGLHEDVPVMVTELTCSEPGCPPVETVIALLETPGAPRQFKIYKPLLDVEREDIQSIAAGT